MRFFCTIPNVKRAARPHIFMVPDGCLFIYQILTAVLYAVWNASNIFPAFTQSPTS